MPMEQNMPSKLVQKNIMEAKRGVKLRRTGFGQRVFLDLTSDEVYTRRVAQKTFKLLKEFIPKRELPQKF